MPDYSEYRRITPDILRVPYGEHDMGRFSVCSEDYYWKIDYDRNLEYHSPNPADPSVTVRVLAVMRFDDY